MKQLKNMILYAFMCCAYMHFFVYVNLKHVCVTYVKVYSLIFCLFKHTCVCLCSFHLYCVISCSDNQTGAGLLSVVLFYQV